MCVCANIVYTRVCRKGGTRAISCSNQQATGPARTNTVYKDEVANLSTVIHRKLCVQSVTSSKIEPCTARDERARPKKGTRQNNQTHRRSLYSLLFFVFACLLACARSTIKCSSSLRRPQSLATKMLLTFLSVLLAYIHTRPRFAYTHPTRHPVLPRRLSQKSKRCSSVASSAHAPSSSPTPLTAPQPPLGRRRRRPPVCVRCSHQSVSQPVNPSLNPPLISARTSRSKVLGLLRSQTTCTRLMSVPFFTTKSTSCPLLVL